MPREPGSQPGEEHQKDNRYKKDQQEWKGPDIDIFDGDHIAKGAFDHKYRHPKGRRHQSRLYWQGGQNAKPDEVEAKGIDDRK